MLSKNVLWTLNLQKCFIYISQWATSLICLLSENPYKPRTALLLSINILSSWILLPKISSTIQNTEMVVKRFLLNFKNIKNNYSIYIL